jgi:hypothetical protein
MRTRLCSLLLLLSAHILLCASMDERCRTSHRFYIYENASCFYNISSRNVGFPLEYTVYDRLLDHPCRTKDSMEAAAVFVPTFGGAFDVLLERAKKQVPQDAPELLECLAHIDASLRSDPRWLRHEGADFYYVYSRTGKCCTGVHPAITKTALGNGWAFTIEPSFVDNTGFTKEMAANYELKPWPHADSLQFKEQCFPLASKRSIGVPYTLFDFRDQRSLAALRKEATASKRRVLMAAQFGLHGRGAGIRQALMRQCLSLPATRCSVMQPHKGAVRVPEYMAAEPDLSASILLEAKFSLQPAGDSPSRGLLYKALRAGSVPVLFQSCASNGFWKNAYTGYFDSIDRFGLHSWAVLLNSTEAMRNDTYVVDELAAIPDDTIKAMSEKALSIAPRTTYFKTYDSTMRDAIDVIVDLMKAPSRHFKTRSALSNN